MEANWNKKAQDFTAINCGTLSIDSDSAQGEELTEMERCTETSDTCFYLSKLSNRKSIESWENWGSVNGPLAKAFDGLLAQTSLTF